MFHNKEREITTCVYAFMFDGLFDPFFCVFSERFMNRCSCPAFLLIQRRNGTINTRNSRESQNRSCCIITNDPAQRALCITAPATCAIKTLPCIIFVLYLDPEQECKQHVMLLLDSIKKRHRERYLSVVLLISAWVVHKNVPVRSIRYMI